MCYIFDSLQQNFLLNKGRQDRSLRSGIHSLYRDSGTGSLSFNVIEIKALKMTKTAITRGNIKKKI